MTSSRQRSDLNDLGQDLNAPKRRRVDAPAAEGGGSEEEATRTNYKGITFRKAKNKWAAQIKHKAKLIDLGAYEEPEDAARAYDQAAICCRGINATGLNFEDYSEDDLRRLSGMLIEDLVAELRNSCRGRRATSKYTGVRRNTTSNSFEAYIRVAGSYVSLGTFTNEVAAAQAYDQAVILRHAQGITAMGKNTGQTAAAVTNFPLDDYRNLFAGSTDAPNADSGKRNIAVLDMKLVETIRDLCDRHKARIQMFRQRMATGDDEEDADDEHNKNAEEPTGNEDALQEEEISTEEETETAHDTNGQASARALLSNALESVDPAYALLKHNAAQATATAEEDVLQNGLWVICDAMEFSRR